MKLFYVVLVSLCVLCTSQPIFAHGDADKKIGTQVNAAISVTWRDDGMLLQDGRWQIPGVLMGGEAYPVEGGVNVDEARFSVHHRTQEGVFGTLQISSHDGVSNAEIHHAFAGVEFDTGAILNTLTAGRMAAAMTPANGEHTSDRLFSETPLPLDAFLGRQLNDDGVRLTMDLGPVQLGAESWRGDAFPATVDGDSGDLFIHYRDSWQQLQWHGGIWWLQADALNRTDSRYSADGHSHGATTVSAPEYWFDGRTELAGAFVRINGRITEQWQWGMEAQYFQADIDGVIRDNTRLAEWQADDNGGWLQTHVGYNNHLVGVRWEQLALENAITGAAALDLAELTGLYNPQHKPERTTLLYRWQIRPNFSFRFEAIEDRIQTESLQRFAVGIIWNQKLYSSH